jgi:hypothetical protein
MIGAEEQALVEKLVAHAPVELSQKPFCIGFRRFPPPPVTTVVDPLADLPDRSRYRRNAPKAVHDESQVATGDFPLLIMHPDASKFLRRVRIPLHDRL